jgi:hypothetical protein
MAIDPEILMAGVTMADGDVPTQERDLVGGFGGLDDLIKANPQFSRPKYELPPLELDLSNFNVDLNKYNEESSKLSDGDKKEIQTMVGDLLNDVEGGNEEALYKALGAAAIGESDNRSLEEMTTDYSEWTKTVEKGPAAIEEFVREALAPNPDDKMESVPEWALPATVFGLTLQSEPGDWRQAMLRARAKTQQSMFKYKQGQKAAAAQVDAAIKEKALDIYTEFQKGKQLSAKEVVDIIGTGKVDPKSLETFMGTGKASDLKAVSIPKDPSKLLEKFTAASVDKFVKGGGTDYNLLIRLPGTADDPNIEYLKQFTPQSVRAFNQGGRKDVSLLVRKPAASGKQSAEDLLKYLETYTAESVEAYQNSGLTKPTLLVPKDPYGMNYPDVGSTDAENQQAVTKMTEDAFINGLVDKDNALKKSQLRKYRMLYMQTIDTAREKIAGEQMVERLPFASITPSQFALKIGLDIDNPDIREIVTIPKVQLPKAKPEDLIGLNALYRLEEKWNTIGQIIEAAPENITGVRGEWWKSTPAKILADVIPGIEIPPEATMAQVFNNVAEVNLIKQILNEARFSDEDRKLVERYITGTKFKNKRELMMRWNEVQAIIEDGIALGEYDLEGRRKPEGFIRGKGVASEDRLSELRTNILELSNQPTN